MAIHRPKSQEILDQATYPFSSKVSFAEAFPQIEDIEATVEESLHATPVIRTVRLDKRSVSEFVNCSEPRCYNGGFNLGNVIHEMVASGKTHHETDLKICQGGGGPPRGRKQLPGSCYHCFKAKVTIKYKPDTAGTLQRSESALTGTV